MENIFIMIIEKKETFKANDTVCFKLTTGEEIIARLISFDDASITISKPVVVQMQMVSQTQAGLGFAPFMATADEETSRFRFERTKLLCDPIKPRSDIGIQYIKMTTGIEMPTGSLLKV